MPGSGSETGFKPITGQFGDYYNTCVPIKKRRIPGFWPPAPPPEEKLSSVTSANEKDNSAVNRGLDSATATVSRAISGLSDVDKTTLSDKNGQNDDTQQKVKVEEPTLAVKPVCSSNGNNGEKVVDAQSSDSRSKSGKLDAICKETDISSDSKMEEEKCKPEVSAASENTGLSLNFKDQPHNVGNLQSEATFEPDSSDLCAKKQKLDVGTGSSVEAGHLPPNRSNWDLNRTMDAWDGTVSDAGADGKNGGVNNEGSLGQSTGHLTCPTGVVGSKIASENQVIKNEQSISAPVVSPMAGQIQKSDSTLQLGLGPPLVRAKETSSEDLGNVISSSALPRLSLSKDGGNVTLSATLPRLTVTMDNRDVGRRSIVKQEPIEEYIRQNVKESEANQSRLVDLRKVKQESVEKSNLDAKLSKISRAELIAPTPIKSEVNETNNESLSFAGKYPVMSSLDTDDDFEDGEVRESEECAATGDYACEERDLGHSSVNYDEEAKGFSVNAGNCFPVMAHAENQEDLARYDCRVRKVGDKAFEDKINDVSAGNLRLQIPPADETSKYASDKKKHDSQRKSLVKTVDTDITKDIGTEESFEQVNDVNSRAGRNILPTGDGSFNTNTEMNRHLDLPKVDIALNENDARKDSVPEVGRSRIIRLPRSSSVSSPGYTRSLSGRSLQSPKRERLPGMMMEGDRRRPRGRGEGYIPRERRQDETFRSSRPNFGHSRGRISSRIDKGHENWDAEHNVVPDYYNDQTDFRVSRHKYASSVGDTDIDYSYKNVSDASFAGNEWGGRKLINNDEAAIMDHPPPRRRSPGEREGPGGQRFQMVRRVSRNISPSRCVGEDGTELVGLGHGRNEDVGPMMTRPQPPFEGVGNHYVRGSRSFQSGRRRGSTRLRSRSPVRSRSRSPRTWCSPRRRSPDGFRGPRELPPRRSPMYRMERIRSPGPFPRETVARRHGSPPYTARTSDLTQEHGHQRPVINNRNTSERFLLRNGRRFDMVDSRERTEFEEHVGGEPVHTADRFQELGGDNSGDERRYSERRGGHSRSFRRPYKRKYHH